MKSTSMDCLYCRREISQMPPACPSCGRTFTLDDYHGYEEEEKKPAWALRLLFFFIFPLLAVGGFLITIGEAVMGFGFVVGGIIVFPSHAVWGGVSIACGAGIWLLMMGKGINTVLGIFSC